MKFYTSIADLYDEIFPYNPPQKSFVESFKVHGPNSTLLDVGCGTGSLTLNMAESFETVIGIDPDKEMLEKANLKAMNFKADRRNQLEELGKWVFLQNGMLDLSTEFAPNSFNTILCFGNTIVHLSTLEEVKEFLTQAFEVLKPGGYLMIQIINYDRIIDQGLKGLSTLENENMKFERVYKYDKDPELINFQTKLTVKESGEVIENEIPLLALRPQQLREMMAESGFANLLEFGSFKKEVFSDNSQPFVVVGKKSTVFSAQLSDKR
ncbi:MAG: class I SAM-dependent methyltransferase [Bacteroidales bacterium]|nr:class I SAM-dependent methyltransferase [Bacteroidales bacterium]